MNPFKKTYDSINSFLGFSPSKQRKTGARRKPEDPQEPPSPSVRPTRIPRGPRRPRSGIDPFPEALKATKPVNDARAQIKIEKGFSKDGVIGNSRETWWGDGSTFTESQSLTFNCAGALIKPTDIKGMCCLGGQPDSTLEACGHCGRFVCAMHGRIVEGATNSVFYCLEHVEEHRKMHYWDQDAIAKGQELRIRPFTPSVKPVQRKV